MDMDFKYHLERSWKTFTQHLPALLICTLVHCIVSFASFFILMPVVSAGYMQSLLRSLKDDRKPEVADLFTHMNLFFPLLGFSVAVGVVLFFGIISFILPGLILGLALTFFCMYMLPLMTEEDMPIIEAIQESSRLAIQDPIAEHFVVVAIFIGLMSLGSSVFIGFLLTQPFATLFILSVFESKKKRALPAPDINKQPPPPPKNPENN